MSEQMDHPCAPCAEFTPRVKRDIGWGFPVCTHPQRLKGLDREWIPCNRQGPNCEHYIKGEQLRLGEI